MWIKGVKFKIGADPEVFVRDRKTRRFVGAMGVVSGTKAQPSVLPIGYCFGQVDGMALEFNIPPSTRVVDFVEAIADGKKGLRWASDSHNLAVVVRSTVEFDAEEWERAPEENKRLGCDPDYCAWDGVHINAPPNPNVTFRSGAGHVAIGWGNRFSITEDYKQVCGALAREMDALLGVSSLLWDQDTKRRELYGKAGAFRPKKFGVEYRTLSNSWVRNRTLSWYVAKQTFKVCKNMMDMQLQQTPEVQHIINDNMVDEAHYFLRHNRISLPPAKYRVV